MIRTIATSVWTAALIAIPFAVIPAVNDAAPGDGPTIVPWWAQSTNMAVALTVLLPAAIALQVLLRLPPIGHASDAARIAQNQYWGGIAAIVSTASAFVALATFVSEIIGGIAIGSIQLTSLLGVPLGAAIAVWFAADAATLAREEGKSLGLNDERRSQSIAELAEARRAVAGTLDHTSRHLSEPAPSRA